ncbi:MAG TPA: murein biosynthesis integral membrane protein MurJ [Terriglobia bacterium]|nr:murein biosynthesis integral membrane protein MurJ [Terriglobia bacterium]
MSSPSVLRRIAQSTGIVMASVLASRVLGFFIYWTVARQVGSNAITDVYYAAFTLPDFLNYLVASGSLSLIFIPVFTKYMAEKREEEAWHVFSIVVTFMGLLLVTLVVLAEIFAPQLVWLLGPGFHPEQKVLLIFLTRLMLPAQICFYLGGILSAVQYAKAQFVVPSFAPIIYNLGIISGGVLLAPRIGIAGFSVGVVAGAVCGNFLLQVYGAARAGARYRPSLDLSHPGFRLFLKLAIPIMLALSVAFTDDWVVRWFGSYLQPASISWLSNAKKLMRLPLGVVGQAVGVASFPFLAQLYSQGKFDELNRTLNSTLKGLILLLLPISALTIAQGSPLVYFVFSYTKMRPSDLDSTAATLMVFSLGMFAWGAQNILARGFYAAHDTLTPAIVGTALTFATLPLYWFLSHRLQHLGLALASSIGIIAYTAALFMILTRRTHNSDAVGLLLFFFKVGIASVMAGGAAYELAGWLESRIAWKTSHGAFMVLVISSTVGLLLIGMLAKIMRVREIDSYLNRLRSS